MIRTRMAPSPTGEYHVGHIRTLLYNYALAKKNNGKFIMRIEDTDQNRKVEGATQKILDVIKEYGIDYDEGPLKEGDYGPYVQSQRLDTYKEYAQKLIDSGKAYYCFCTKDRLKKLREEQQSKGMPVTKYDKHCLSLSKEEIESNLALGKDYVIRLNVPSNQEISFDDEVYGKITFNTNDIDDQVLLKSDGFPVYHLAVVVDDHLMKITHIMRGNDWIPSTPKHILLYKAFGFDIPKFIHLPNLKELEGNKKLSKRFGAVFAKDFLKEGYLVEAMLNFLMFLGWNPGTDKEIYSMQEFINDFSISRIQKTDLVAFDRKKLLWINGHYIRERSPQDLWVKLKQWSSKYDVKINGYNNKNDEYMVKVLSLVQERMKTLSEFNDFTDYYFSDPAIDTKLLHKFSKSKDRTKQILGEFLTLYKKVSDQKFTRHNLEEISKKMVLEKEFSNKEAYMTLRVALTSKAATPQIFDMLPVLSKKVVIKRLETVISTIN